MKKQEALRLWSYNLWANHKLWGYVMALAGEQFERPSDYSIGSVHKQVIHMMDAESVWLARVRGTAPEIFHDAADFPTRESIRARWDAVEAAWQAYLNTLPDGDVQGVIEYFNQTKTQQFRTPLWEILAHVVNHATDHRAQVLALIHQLGGETGPQDLIAFTREHPADA